MGNKSKSARQVKEHVKKEHNLLKAALVDLENQLTKLRSSKRGQEKKLDSVADKIIKVQDMEVRLREAISRLMKTESNLDKEKENCKDKLTVLRRKIEKIRSIQNDLKEV